MARNFLVRLTLDDYDDDLRLIARDLEMEIDCCWHTFDVVEITEVRGLPGGYTNSDMLKAATADVVSKELYDQIKWERDVAIATLEEHGVGLGEKK